VSRKRPFMDRIIVLKKFSIFVVLLIIAILIPSLVLAELTVPSVVINTGSGDAPGEQIFSGLKLALLLSTLAFIPAIVMTGTSFTRTIIILGLVRQALGTAQTPPNQVLVGLGLCLTIAIMSPVFEQVYEEAFQPYTQEQITHQVALKKAFAPVRTFMLRHTREQDLAWFVEVARQEMPDSPEELGPTVVVPAFLLSELNTAFQIGFLIFMPFLVLDMIVSSVLTSMSMITLPPTVISLPIKLMLFVVVDGWHLVIGNLVKSYHV